MNTAQEWWHTEIVDIQPGIIRMRGYPIEELVGRLGFAEMVWLMLRGERPSPVEAGLLEAAMVAAVDHGPHAPSIAIARMAMTCGVGINNAMASAINALGDIHGGAGQQCMEFYSAIAARCDQGMTVADAAKVEVQERLSSKRMIEGFGHRFHPVDPRADRLLTLVDDAVNKEALPRLPVAIGRAVVNALQEAKGKTLPMNIDGATAVVYSTLGFSPELARGLFVISRSVGILAHAWEQHQQGGRIKGPLPPAIPYTYTGLGERTLEGGGQ